MNSDCPVCLLDHDPRIHAATVNVHRWFREKLELALSAPEQPEKTETIGSRVMG